MTHMQACARGIREHVQDIKFRLTVVNINLIHFVVAPILLPLLLDFTKVIIHIIAVLFSCFEKKLQKYGKFAL
jgi:hypothetical protein